MAKPSDQTCQLPAHVAIIMDGNGRWATTRGLPRVEGHRQGRKTVKRVVRWSGKIGIRYLTLYAFSTENWQRPKAEVNALMQLFNQVLEEEIEELDQQGVKLRFIGSRRRLSSQLRAKMKSAEQRLQKNRGLSLQIAVDYGGREELLEAFQKAFSAGKRLTRERDLESFLHTQGMPDPDLLIRTGGDQRISNFLLWQLAYTELYFCRIYWPDFSLSHYKRALRSYARRKRKFGGIL